MNYSETTVVVIGAGFMGAGIAQICIQKRIKCLLIDRDKDILEKARRTIQGSVEKLHEKGLLETGPDEILAKLETMDSLDLPGEPSWVIEAVFEDEALKKNLLKEVEKQVDKRTLIATNTSSIPVSRLAECLSNPNRFVGLHFFGPVPLMELVEVVKGRETSEVTFSESMSFIQLLGKYPVGVRKDIPGFAMNRVFSAAFRECLELVQKGIVSVEDLDTGMRLGYGWRAGPFQIADNAGLDTVMRISRLMKALGETYLYSDTDMIEKMVEKGNLGRKSGRGFYRYDSK